MIRALGIAAVMTGMFVAFLYLAYERPAIAERARAEEMKNQEARLAMLACAENYQRLADMAEQREKECER